MKQGNGIELLGSNDPNGTNIGVIYVAPTDDRKSVLAAILTQENLHRKQIAVVLPEQNEAFQRPSDFEELRKLHNRNKVKAEIVFIAPNAPGGRGPAEFARQRHFAVHSTLDHYTNALRDEAQKSAPPKKGGLFGSGKYKTPGALPATQGNQQGRRDNVIIPMPMPVLPATPPSEARVVEAAAPGEHYNQPNTPVGTDLSHPSPYGTPYSEHDTDYEVNPQSSHPLPDDDDWALAPSPLPPPISPLPIPTTPDTTSGAPSSPEPASMPPMPPARNTLSSQPEPNPIELPVRGGRVTAKLVPNAPAAEGSKQRGGGSRRRDSGKMAAASAAGAAAAAVLAGAAASGRANMQNQGGTGTSVATRATGGGGLPPARANFGGGGGGGRGPRRRSRKPLVVLAILLAVLLLIGGIMATLAYAFPASFPAISKVLPRTSPPATITITPASQVVSNSYIIPAVTTGKPDPAQHQVSARPLTSAPQSQSKAIPATGHNQTAAVVARGRVTFSNGSFTKSFVEGTNTAISTVNGVQFFLDAPTTIPVATQNGFGTITVSAHAATAGSAGNIGAFAISQPCCDVNGNVFVKNFNNFGGGVDPKNYNFVKQSDVDAATAALSTQLTGQANTALQSQLKPGEQLAQATSCPATVSTDNQVGDKGVNVNSTNLTVSVTCKAEAYDQNGLQDLVGRLLLDKAAATLGQGYALKNNLIIHSRVQGINPDNTVLLLVDVKGLWVYQFSAQQQADLAKLIAGKPVDTARTLLKSQRGVQDAVISVNGGNLPSDPGQITFSIQPVAPIQDTGTPTVGSTPGGTPGAGATTPISTQSTPGPGTPLPARG